MPCPEAIQQHLKIYSFLSYPSIASAPPCQQQRFECILHSFCKYFYFQFLTVEVFKHLITDVSDGILCCESKSLSVVQKWHFPPAATLGDDGRWTLSWSCLEIFVNRSSSCREMRNTMLFPAQIYAKYLLISANICNSSGILKSKMKNSNALNGWFVTQIWR